MAIDGMSGITLRSLWEERVREFADKDFLIFQNRAGEEFTFTYAKYDRHVNRVANYFMELGVTSGDMAAVHLRNSAEFISCLLGLAKFGGVMCPINEGNLKREILYVLEKCHPKAVVTEPDFLPMYCEIRAEHPELIPHLLLGRSGDEDVEGVPNFVREVLDRSPLAPPAPPMTDRDTVEVMFTSGTTSMPKGVELMHANMVFSGQYSQWQTTLRSDDRLVTTMPACHSNFQLAAMMPVIQAGATLIMLEKYSAHKFMRQVRHYRGTVIQCVSLMVRTMLLQPEDPDDANNEIREVLYFLPLDTADKEAFEKRFGVHLMNSYGSTESVGWAITDYPTGKRKWPSVGRVGPGYQAKVIDDRGYELPSGEVGEILIKGEPGRSIMKGYFRDPEITRSAIDSHKWLHTGDKGYFDEEGYFFFVDRKSNMIKRAGENISTTEIEDILMGNPDVAEAAVIGVPDPIRDQAVKAFVVPCEGATLTEDDIRAYCKENLAAFKVPSFIEIRAALPHTTSMKVEKKLLS